MRALILAGGYAKRMWPLTRDIPKTLLTIDGRPAIDYLVERLVEAKMTRIVVSTNLKFKPQFEAWLQGRQDSNVEIVAESSTREEEKLGAVKALAELGPGLESDDYLIIAGDNIFNTRLNGIINFYKRKRASVVAIIKANNEDEVKLGSSVLLANDMRITSFEEKPSQPRSMLIGACIYLMSKDTILRSIEYLSQGGRTDEPGNFVAWLCKKEPVYGYVLQGRLWDIGTIESYERLKQEFAGPEVNSSTKTTI